MQNSAGYRQPPAKPLHLFPVSGGSGSGLLQVVKQNVKVPIYVMIRPRGGDFLYSEQEVEVMRRDIQLMKSHGADGLVLGLLTEDGRVDAELCMELLGTATFLVQVN